MLADWTEFRAPGTHNDAAAVPAFPDLDLGIFKHFVSFRIVQQGAVALRIVLFDGTTIRKRTASSLKPAASAVLEKISSISVHLSFSPLAAAPRFSAVEPMPGNALNRSFACVR